MFLGISVFALGLFVVCITAALGLTLVLRFTWARPGYVLAALVALCALVSVTNSLLTQRVLQYTERGLAVLRDGDMGTTLLGKLLLLALVGAAFGICLAWFLQRWRRQVPLPRYDQRGLAELSAITIAFFGYFVAFNLLPLVFAPAFDFHVSLVYPIFVFLAILLAMRASSVDPVEIVRHALAFIVLASLVTAVVWPSFALQPGYRSLIPGFDSRLWGVTPHANSLGSVAGTLLVLQFARPSEHRLWHMVLMGAAALALLMSQSKAAAAGALFALGLLLAWRLWFVAAPTARGAFTAAAIGRVALLFAGAGLVAVVWYLLADATAWSRIEAQLDPAAVDKLSTFTGRTAIWAHALERGLDNPFFGQGRSMWNLEARLETGLSAAMHAHNLYLQAFSRSGLVGLISLLVLLFYLIRFAFRAAIPTCGGSLALLALFLARSIFEVPLQPNSVLGAEFFGFLAVLLFSVEGAAQRAPAPAHGVRRLLPVRLSRPYSGYRIGGGTWRPRATVRR